MNFQTFVYGHSVQVFNFYQRALDWSMGTRLSTSTTFKFQTSDVPRELTPVFCWSVDVKALGTSCAML